MAVNATYSLGHYLYINGRAGATEPYLDHFHYYCSSDSSGTIGALLGVYDAVSGVFTHANWFRTIAPNNTTTRYLGVRAVDSTFAYTATTANMYPLFSWSTMAAAFISSSLRESWVAGDNTNKGVNTGGMSLPTVGYNRLGSLPDGTSGQNNFHLAEISRWDVTGFSATDRNALISRLNTTSGGVYPNPRTVNDDVEEPWSGKLVRYWPLTTNSNLADALGSGDNWVMSGTVNTSSQGHPNIAEYNPTASLKVVASLKELDGITALPSSLTDVRWAWFDTEPGTAQMTPIDYGTTLTISSGALSISLPNTSLALEDFGYLVLEHIASGRRQAYRLQVVEDA